MFQFLVSIKRYLKGTRGCKVLLKCQKYTLFIKTQHFFQMMKPKAMDTK